MCANHNKSYVGKVCHSGNEKPAESFPGGFVY